MINNVRFIWQLLVLTSVLLILGILVIPMLGIKLSLSLYHYIITLLSVAGISLLTYLVMTRGILKSNLDGVVISLAGIGVKFLLYLLYILVYWLVTKNLTKPFIITFFALYLIFTILLAGHLFKLLKNK